MTVRPIRAYPGLAGGENHSTVKRTGPHPGIGEIGSPEVFNTCVKSAQPTLYRVYLGSNEHSARRRVPPAPIRAYCDTIGLWRNYTISSGMVGSYGSSAPAARIHTHSRLAPSQGAGPGTGPWTRRRSPRRCYAISTIRRPDAIRSSRMVRSSSYPTVTMRSLVRRSKSRNGKSSCRSSHTRGFRPGG